MKLNFRHFFIRLEEISSQYKRKVPISDTSFESDFGKAIELLRDLSDENISFWKETRNKYYNEYKKMINQDYRFLIKQINICAIAFTRQTDELFTIYKNLQSLGKELPLKINWWLFENSTQALLNTTSRILFLIRNMEKYYA